MSIRRQLSHATVTALHSRLQHAYQRDDVRLVRRTTGRIDLLVHHVPVSRLCERWGLSPACLSDWQKAFVRRGMDSLVYHQSGGRPAKLPPRQRKRLVERMEAGPLVGGFAPACWHAGLLGVLIWREVGVRYNRHYVCTVLHNLGCAFQQARLVSDPLEAAKRLAWWEEKGPALFRAAKRQRGRSLFEEEASCAPWGSLRDTWARRGHQPEVPTSGKRQGDKVVGARAYFSGRLFSQGIEGRGPSAHSQAFWHRLMDHTTAHLFVLPDGAHYHTSASPQAFLAAHSERRTAPPLPSSSPDDTPMESLWRQTKQRATHNKSCKELVALTVSGDKALAYFATPPATVLGLFGRDGEESGLALKQAA